jgi:hypothetical protein
MKYRKKPVVIDAHQWDGNLEAAMKWVEGVSPDPTTYLQFDAILRRLFVVTLEGKMQVPHGNFIIRGVRGELYSCEPNIFKETYDVVVERETPEQRAERAYERCQETYRLNLKLQELGLSAIPSSRKTKRPGYHDED